MDDALETKLAKATVTLLRLQPFYGTLLLQLIRVPRPDLKPATLATDGKHLFYHPDWVRDNPSDVVEAGLAHEVTHCALDHLARRGDREPRRWNEAVDHVSNLMLRESGFRIPNDWYCNPQYTGMPAEQVYNLLPPRDDDDSSDDGFDEHMLPAEETTTNNWKIATVQAANAQLKAHGSLPASMQRFVDELLHPKEDWRARLRHFATESCRNDYSWAKPNRMYASIGLIMPSLYSTQIRDITCVGDTSGSVTDAIWQALVTEMADIHVSAQPSIMRAICCDADIQSVSEFAPHDPFEMEAKGFGGTDFRPPFAWLEERDIRPSCLIYLTDGYGPFPDAPSPYPVLWVMTTDVIPPWGEHVRIEL